MAKPDHTSVTHHGARIPTNPLSRPCSTLADASPDERDAATLAGLTTAIHALARVLANSEAFRDLHANSESNTIDPGCSPLDAPTTEGLFAALYFLSEQAEQLSQLPLPAPLHPSNVSY
ncbi:MULTISPECIES: hypothetical protein [unclassified Rhodanobacter]|uniref:hypothetical protein n=1 Tax=unclassified Rhodanobacter TaxID=2621553 RepID=UPI001BE11937|nr:MULTISPECIES: hypothetical protein [unclassified Rhodanobacter]MBT2144959.1 hypothetical protein [Rhodanobacter sp. LX-99]MBT2149004.1 hypothetical protein [Rhodanobacter sp. LX-100]